MSFLLSLSFFFYVTHVAHNLRVGHGQPDVGVGTPGVGGEDARPVERVRRVIDLTKDKVTVA